MFVWWHSSADAGDVRMSKMQDKNGIVIGIVFFYREKIRFLDLVARMGLPVKNGMNDQSSWKKRCVMISTREWPSSTANGLPLIDIRGVRNFSQDVKMGMNWFIALVTGRYLFSGIRTQWMRIDSSAKANGTLNGKAILLLQNHWSNLCLVGC